MQKYNKHSNEFWALRFVLPVRATEARRGALQHLYVRGDGHEFICCDGYRAHIAQCPDGYITPGLWRVELVTKSEIYIEPATDGARYPNIDSVCDMHADTVINLAPVAGPAANQLWINYSKLLHTAARLCNWARDDAHFFTLNYLYFSDVFINAPGIAFTAMLPRDENNIAVADTDTDTDINTVAAARQRVPSFKTVCFVSQGTAQFSAFIVPTFFITIKEG